MRCDAFLWTGAGLPALLICEVARARAIPLVILWSAQSVANVANRPVLAEALKTQPMAHAARDDALVEALGAMGLPASLVCDDGDMPRFLDSVVQQRVPRERAVPRLAVSGFDVFASAVARYTEELFPQQWEPHLLRFDSKLDHATSIVVMVLSNVWYSIGGPPHERWLAPIARSIGKKRIVHWVGRDVELVERGIETTSGCRGPYMRHLAETAWMAEPLNRLGLRTQIASLPPRFTAREVPALPERFTVLLYVPATRGEHYGRDVIRELMRETLGAEIRYLIVGGGALEIPDGVEAVNLGWQHSLEAIYPQATVLVRLVDRRDGLSLMVLEALSFGRHVVWTQSFPYVAAAAPMGLVREIVAGLYARHCAGTLGPQRDAAQFIEREYSVRPAMGRLQAVWSSAGRSAPGRSHG